MMTDPNESTLSVSPEDQDLDVQAVSLVTRGFATAFRNSGVAIEVVEDGAEITFPEAEAPALD